MDAYMYHKGPCRFIDFNVSEAFCHICTFLHSLFPSIVTIEHNFEYIKKHPESGGATRQDYMLTSGGEARRRSRRMPTPDASKWSRTTQRGVFLLAFFVNPVHLCAQNNSAVSHSLAAQDNTPLWSRECPPPPRQLVWLALLTACTA